MITNFTLNQLSEFTQNEQLFAAELGLVAPTEEQIEPPKHVIDNILNYSKALSVRTTKTLGKVHVVLN